MHLDILDQLRSKRLQLVAAFCEHVEDVHSLRRRAIDELVPDIVDLRGLSGEDEEKWLLELLEDDGELSVDLICRANSFVH